MSVNIDVSDFQRFFEQVDRAARGGLRRELEGFLEGLAYEFLNVVQNVFMSMHNSGDESDKPPNTGHGQLLQSFTRDNEHTIWRYVGDGLTIEVGNSLEYAGFVNDGHRTLDPAKNKYFTLPNGEMARFVPGYWDSEHRFVYDPAAEGGMVLKYHWVEGLHFWEAAMRAMEELCPEFLSARLEQWLNEYFGF